MKKMSILLLMSSLFTLMACSSTDSASSPVSNSVASTVSSESGAGVTSSTSIDDSKATYSCTVLLPNGDPATTVSVQWCDSSSCRVPQKVNANGVASMSLTKGEYYVHVINLPEGYTYEPNGHVQTETNNTSTINLIKLADLEGTGTSADMYKFGVNTYEVVLSSKTDVKYFTFLPTEAGTYTITSLVTVLYATNPMDPVLGVYGNTDPSNTDNMKEYKDNISKTDYNFSYEVTVDASAFENGTLKEEAKMNFSVSLSAATNLNTSFADNDAKVGIKISKK